MSPTLSVAISLLIALESGGNPKAFNEAEQAVGILQIRPILVKDVNRILNEWRFDHADCWDPTKSIEIARVYLEHYGTSRKFNGRSPSVLEYMLLWCAGPDGPFQKKTPAMQAYIERALAKARAYKQWAAALEN